METKDIVSITKDLYYDYAKYVNLGGRTIPLVYDTLKTVQRRVLLSAYELTKSGDFVKSAKIVGHTIGSYHPHGDVACYGALVTMVQQGLMEGRGNFGSTAGLDKIEPASYRYTECRLNPEIKDIAFRYIDIVPHFENELNTQEPLYLPTMLPLNLIAFSDQAEPVTGIGVGYKMKYTLPLFDKKEIIELFIKMIDNQLTGREKLNLVYKSIKVPAPKALLTKGEANVKMVAHYSVSDNGKEIIIYDFPYSQLQLPTSMLSKIEGTPIDKSTRTTEVIVKLNKGKYANDYDLDKILSANTTFNMMFHDNNQIKIYSVYDLCKLIYDSYKSTVLIDLNNKHQKYINNINYLKLLIKIKPHVKSLDISDIARKVKEKEDVIADIFKHTTLDTLANVETKLEEEQKRLNEIENNINNIDAFCKKQYEELI